MIFQHTWQAVIEGRKTQTRRIVKPGDWFYFDHATEQGGQHCVFNGDREADEMPRLVYAVGKTYAVQPGRGKKAAQWRYSEVAIGGRESREMVSFPEMYSDWTPLRIRITSIHREDVRQISEDDALAEGFGSKGDFWYTWISMHDKNWLETYRYAKDTDQLHEYGFYTRPAERYDAWGLVFEVAAQDG